MKWVMGLVIFLCLSIESYSQQKKLYNSGADANADIATAIRQAAEQNKHVLLQAGGNWCGWCIEFNRFCTTDRGIDSVISQNFIVYHLNWSKENENQAIFKKLGYPQRFGFPVLVVLNANGERIHTQNTEYLEDGNKSYNREKVLSFLKNWSPAVLDSKTYE